ncbi:MAG: hypothetical protein NTV58_05210 [Deltaproteobacteria bacterium]|nr:hypothetical protein [Deltaproteobacteria bacterium]
MQPWLEQCESWLLRQYANILGLNLLEGPMRLRWLSVDSLSIETGKQEAQGLAILDDDIGWMFFLLPYDRNRFEHQVNQALGLRSRLLRESNYTGQQMTGENEDKLSSWRIGIIWLVDDVKWISWQDHILKLRRESGAAEEISLDAVRIIRNDVHAALDNHGLPRLLLHTRMLLAQSARESEEWRSADAQILAELQKFSAGFGNPRARTFARELEEKAKSFQPSERSPLPSEARKFHSFCIEHFRNLDHLQIDADHNEATKAQAIVLFGPNSTGKTSFAEALSLAAFGSSLRLEQFLSDEDLPRVTVEAYLRDYLTPINNRNARPIFVFGKDAVGDKIEGHTFNLNPDDVNKRRFDGIVLNQEESIKFANTRRQDLAARVLKGYSALADHLLAWLVQEEKRANETKLTFTRKHGLSGAIKLSKTAYKGLAEGLLQKQFQRPSSEFLDWLRFWGRTSGEDGRLASNLISEWTNQQSTVVDRLAGILSKLQEKGESEPQLTYEILARLHELDELARQSGDFRKRLENRIATLHDQLDNALIQIEAWGTWLSSQKSASVTSEADSSSLKVEIDRLAKERKELEITGRALRGRLDLLDQSKQYLSSHWITAHPDTCPVCNSDVSQRQGIMIVVSNLQQEINETIQKSRVRHVEIQNQQKQLDAKVKATGLATCPLAAEDQARIKDWLTPFMPIGAVLEDLLINPQHREQLKGDLKRMKILPEAPKPYADTDQEARRLASDFISMSQEADRALEDPQAIGEVKNAFEQRLEKVLKDHLPSTLEKVWLEITLTLTTAAWLLPEHPTLKIDQRGKSLSVQTRERGQHIRYIYNAAECHILGLAWFFTYYLARRRFEEAWILLDDPAQELDQPSFRELVRFWETLLRFHQKMERYFTMIVALHQEERALDTARATNGKLYILGWKDSQQDLSDTPSIKKVVMLAPGFHPLKPDRMIA